MVRYLGHTLVFAGEVKANWTWNNKEPCKQCFLSDLSHTGGSRRWYRPWFPAPPWAQPTPRVCPLPQTPGAGQEWPEGRRHNGPNREDEAESSTFLHRHGVNTVLNILNQWNWFDYLHADLDHLLDLIGPPKDHDNLDQLHWLLLAASEPWPAPRRPSWVSCRASPGWTRSTPRPPPGVSTSSLVIFLSVKILTYLRDTSAISYFTNVLKNEILDNRCRPFYSIPKPQNDEVRWWPNWTFGLLCVWDRVSGDWTGLWLGNKTMYFSLHLSKAKIEGSRHVCAA